MIKVKKNIVKNIARFIGIDVRPIALDSYICSNDGDIIHVDLDIENESLGRNLVNIDKTKILNIDYNHFLVLNSEGVWVNPSSVEEVVDFINYQIKSQAISTDFDFSKLFSFSGQVNLRSINNSTEGRWSTINKRYGSNHIRTELHPISGVVINEDRIPIFVSPAKTTIKYFSSSMFPLRFDSNEKDIVVELRIIRGLDFTSPIIHKVSLGKCLDGLNSSFGDLNIDLDGGDLIFLSFSKETLRYVRFNSNVYVNLNFFN